MHTTELIANYPLISDQVNKDQVGVILKELEIVLNKKIDGAVAEFGCYIGTTSLFIRRLLDRCDPARPLHVYDSFAGLPPKTTADASLTGENFTAGALAASKKTFLREFHKAHLRPPAVHKGWFKDLTADDLPPQIAFAFLDGDFYESIRDSLRLVLPRLQPGGTIVVDDYAREALPGAAKAVHELIPSSDIRTHHNLGVYHKQPAR